MKESHDARHLFQIAKERARKKPHILIIDGLRSYHDAWMKDFRTQKLADTRSSQRNLGVIHFFVDDIGTRPTRGLPRPSPNALLTYIPRTKCTDDDSNSVARTS